jgi:hypothetical protein
MNNNADTTREYSLEEREEQIAVVQRLRGKKREDNLQRPKSLIEALARPEPPSTAGIKALAKVDYSSPVTSLYLRMESENVAPPGTAVLRAFHSLKTRALEEQKGFIEALPKPQKELLHDDLEEIEVLLTRYFVSAGPRALILFKSGEQLNRVFRLPAWTVDSLVIDADPHIGPLEAVLEENEKVLFVEVSIGESRLLVYQLGDLEEDRITTSVPKKRAGPPYKRNEEHRLTHLQWHLKATATRAYHLFQERSCAAVILMGEHKVLASLEEILHETLRANIIARIHASPNADPRDRKELIETAIRDHKAGREVKAIEEVAQYKPGEQMVSGLGDVIDVFNSFVVRKLVIGENLQQKGYICKAHHYVSLEETDCPFCGAKPLPVENIVDEIIQIAYLHGVSLTLVEYRQDLLTPYNGIAAITYPHLTQREETV